MAQMQNQQTIALQLEKVRDKVPLLYERDDVLLSMIQQRGDVEKVSSRNMRIPLQLIPGGKAGSYNADGGDLGRGSGTSYDVAQVSPIFFRFAVEISKLVDYATNAREKAIENAAKREVANGIMGSADPNYASPPAGWRKMKLGGPVDFVGLSANTSPAASTTSWTTVVNCGNNSSPGVWLSGVAGVTISRLRMVSESVRVSMDSNGGRNNATNPSAQIEFDHDDFRSDCSGCGPTMDVGGNMLWLSVHDSTFENGAIANWSVSANSSQASNISISNGGGSGAIGLLYFTQNFFSGGGGLRFDANTNSSASVYAAHTLMEGAGACQPVYEIINGGTFAATFDVQGGFSDCGASPPFVKVAAGNQPCQTSVRGINQGGQVPGLEGPLTVGDATCPGGNPSGGVSVSDAGVPSAGVIPAAKGQSGGAYGTSQYADSYRRSFAPSFVRFANTANQLPATWTAYQGSGQTLTPIQGPGDPAASTNAATLSCTGQSGFGCSYYAFDSNITFNAGDYVYVGAWMQAASTAGFGSGSAIGVIFPFGNGPTMRQMTGGPAGVGGGFSGGTTQLSSAPYFQNDGNWQYVWGLSKVTAPFSGTSGTIFTFAFQPGYPVNVYAPMFVRIPASSVAVVSAPTFSSASESGNIVTFTTSAAHHLSRGEPIVVSGCSISGYNGEFVLGNTISSTTFTVYSSATGLGSPTGCAITPENDSEVADWANNLKPYSDKCSTGVLCGVVSNPAISASGLNNVIFVDGVTYSTIAAAQAALPSGKGTVWVTAGSPAQTISTSLTWAGQKLIVDPGVTLTIATGGQLTFGQVGALDAPGAIISVTKTSGDAIVVNGGLAKLSLSVLSYGGSGGSTNGLVFLNSASGNQASIGQITNFPGSRPRQTERRCRRASWNAAALIERSDGTAQFFIGNGAGTGKIYELSDTQLSDDGAAIPSYYTTYFFPSQDQEDGLGVRSHRKLFSYLTCYAEGAGNLSLTSFAANEAFATALPPLALGSPGSKDLEMPVNVLAERAAFQVGTNQAGSWFRLSRLVASLAADPWSPVRGGN